MIKSLTEKKLIIVNIIIVSYFVLIYIINLYKLDNSIIGVLREMLTIPFLIGQIVLLILGCIFLIKNRKTHFLTKSSIILLAICSIITIGSFI
jgi:hypothetical protein